MACGLGVTCFTKIKNQRNRGTILTLLGCAVQPIQGPTCGARQDQVARDVPQGE
jgi:hypothetical protein